jgi:hypothetical protein
MIQNCIVGRSCPESCAFQRRIDPLFWAKTGLGTTMLAIPAPATLPTNCRRDIIIEFSPERYT